MTVKMSQAEIPDGKLLWRQRARRSTKPLSLACLGPTCKQDVLWSSEAQCPGTKDVLVSNFSSHVTSVVPSSFRSQALLMRWHSQGPPQGILGDYPALGVS